MKRSFKRTTACLMMTVGLASIPAAQARQTHADTHAHHGVAQVELEHGQRWATDAPLREAMGRIRTAVHTARQADKRGGMTSAQVTALNAAIDKNIAYMVQNCRLAPKADADLHALIGRLSAAMAAIKANPKARDGLPQMLEVLETYPHRFNHPGWDTPAHGR